MRAILAIAAAHFRQEWKSLLLPLVAGLAALILRTMNPESFTAKVLGGLTMLAAPVAAVLLGLNLLGPDLRQRRLSFFFSRPCSPWQLWWGRLLGAMLVLILASVPMVIAAILGGPAVNASPDASAEMWTLMIPLAVLLLATNAAICILASPAADAFLVDLVAITAIVVSAYWSLGRVLELIGSPGSSIGIGLAIPITFAFALLPAGLAYLWGGKGRARWGHRWFSWTLWPVVALSVVGINAWRIQEENLHLSDVQRYPARGRALDENHVLINLWEGHPRWFAVDVRTGASERVKITLPVGSRNGAFLGWVAPVWPASFPPKEAFDLVVARTRSINEPLSRIKTRCLFPLVDLSDDGERALCRSRDGLEVHNTRTGEVEGRTQDGFRVSFSKDRSIEAALMEASAFRFVTLSFDGSVLHEERLPRPPHATWEMHAATGRRALVETARTALFSETGKLLGSLAGSTQSAFFTRDGRLVVTSFTRVPHPETQVNSITLLEGDGSPPRVLPGLAGRPHVVGELSTGEIVVRTLVRGTPTTLLVDLKTLGVRSTLEGFDSLGRNDPRGGYFTAADTLLRVFQNDNGDLYYLDPAATKLRLLVKSTREDF